MLKVTKHIKICQTYYMFLIFCPDDNIHPVIECLEISENESDVDNEAQYSDDSGVFNNTDFFANKSEHASNNSN